MPCTYHPEVESTAFCTQCGHALCSGCVRMVRNSIYCEDCLAASVKKPNTTTQTVTGNDPETAFALGLIPGVGAIYNGEYFKAAIHVLIFGMLTSLGFLMAVAFYFYMPFEAYYTAKKRKLQAQGVHIVTPIDQFYEQFNAHTGGIRNKEFWGGIGLVVLGSLYLLNTYEVFTVHAAALWPCVLIAVGVVLLLRSRETKSQ